MKNKNKSISMDAPLTGDDDSGNMYDTMQSNKESSPDTGLMNESLKKEIKTAFKDRVERYHPDKIRNLGKKRQLDAESKRQKLEKAYEFLLKKD